MYSFPDLEPACCSMSSSNWCFLRNQEADQVVWYSHLLKNFPQFVVIHTVKGFGVVNKTDVFLELSCFFDDPAGVGNLISGSSAFSKSSLDIWKFMVHILLKLQSCPTLCDPMDCSLPGSSVHGIFKARVLEWGAIAFSESQRKVMPKNAQTTAQLHSPHMLVK